MANVLVFKKGVRPVIPIEITFGLALKIINLKSLHEIWLEKRTIYNLKVKVSCVFGVLRFF